MAVAGCGVVFNRVASWVGAGFVIFLFNFCPVQKVLIALCAFRNFILFQTVSNLIQFDKTNSTDNIEYLF